MISISSSSSGIGDLRKALGEAQKKLPKEIAIAINATGKMARREIGKVIREELAVKKQIAEKPIKSGPPASTAKLGVTVTLKKEKRISFREFSPRQNKQGVTYKISKKGGRKLIKGAFQGPTPTARKVSWRGNAFVRAGKSRLPIIKIKGVSPWGVFVGQSMTPQIQKKIERELKKQIERRTRLVLLRAQGTVAKAKGT